MVQNTQLYSLYLTTYFLSDSSQIMLFSSETSAAFKLQVVLSCQKENRYFCHHNSLRMFSQWDYLQANLGSSITNKY